MTVLARLACVIAILLPFASIAAEGDATPASPLVIGETFSIRSKVLDEDRRINVYRPAGYDAEDSASLPVLYMPDGGLGEDFLHVAGLVQIGAANGSMRPFLLVGIENTERRRDMTGPTEDPRDRESAPNAGGSAKFRAFLRDELMPQVRSRYRTTDETAIVGESLAGLFVVETLVEEPGLFDHYIAIDPSVWWNNEALVRGAAERLRQSPPSGQTLFLASSKEAGKLIDTFADSLKSVPGLELRHQPMPAEGHGTIYHPAALMAFRTLLGSPATEEALPADSP